MNLSSYWKLSLTAYNYALYSVLWYSVFVACNWPEQNFSFLDIKLKRLWSRFEHPWVLGSQSTILCFYIKIVGSGITYENYKQIRLSFSSQIINEMYSYVWLEYDQRLFFLTLWCFNFICLVYSENLLNTFCPNQYAYNSNDLIGLN